MSMKNSELVLDPLKVCSAIQTSGMLTFSQICDPGNHDLAGYMGLLVWGPRSVVTHPVEYLVSIFFEIVSLITLILPFV